MATKLVLLDVTNTIIKVKGGVGRVYRQLANDMQLNYFKLADTEIINSRFKMAFSNHWSQYPNFGFGKMPVSSILNNN
ncbi:hypothetical protein EB796_013975 [Bugula neritina]|uniref:Uncharacterized protein n=1 Tax=Bugula neritina TaxID=10212 RepID=A0A7J7JMY2_BUGNE|nr:hypothetical protein EB796_013975 [Bugula neritina]